MVPPSKIQFSERALGHTLLVLQQLMGPSRFARLFGRMHTRLLQKIEHRLQASGTGTTFEVDRRTSLSPEEFHKEYFSRSRPVILSGAARNWPCCSKWTLDFFSVGLGEHDLLLMDSPGLTTREARNDHEFLPLKELVRDIRSGGDKYLRFSPLLHENPQLTRDLDMQWLAAMRGGKTFGNTYYMFMGGRGRKTLLHADQPCNLYVQVYGEKKWTMYLPEDSLALYPEVTNTAYVKSPVDIEHADATKYPLFRHARTFEAHLKPGDVLYVPPHVWHQVENLTDTIAVGYRFSSLAAAVRSSLAFSLVRILSTNPPVWKTRAYGKIDTNLIWAHTSGKIKDVMAEKQNRLQRPRELQ